MKTKQEKVGETNKTITPVIKKSVEILKTVRIAKPTKLFYYYVERNQADSIMDSVLIMTPVVYDTRVKKPIWSSDSSEFAYENLLSCDTKPQIEIFNTKTREKVFKLPGTLLGASNDLDTIIFTKMHKEKILIMENYQFS